MKKLLPLIVICLVFILMSHGTVAQTYTSITSGSWDSPSTWDLNAVPPNTANVVVAAGDVVTLATSVSIVNLDIQSTATLNAANIDLTVTGNLTVNGIYTSGASAQNLTIQPTTSSNVDGDGTISINSLGSAVSVFGTVTILSSADLTINGNMTLIGFGATTVTNQGIVAVSGNVNGFFGNPSWVNAMGSRLSVGGLLMNTGSLTATATDNVIEYISGSNQNIKTPASSTYYNLVISGTATFDMLAPLIITDTLKITSGTLSTGVGNFGLNIGGDFIIGSTFTEGTGTVTLDGTADQNLSIASDNTFYNLTINKAGGTVIADNNITVSNTLTLTSGNVDMSGNTLTLGTSDSNIGTLVSTSGRIIGSFTKWIDAPGTFELPIGVTDHDRTVSFTLNNTLAVGEEGTITATFIDSSPGNAGLASPLNEDGIDIFSTFPEGYWSLTGGNGINVTDYNVDLTGGGFNELPPSVSTTTRVLVRANSASDWILEGTHQAADDVNLIARRVNANTFNAEYAFGATVDCSSPPTTSAITGNTSVCTDVTGESYSVNLNAGNTYTWTITGGTISGIMPATNTTSGTDLFSISVDWGSPGQIGTVSVFENNVNCTGDLVTLDVTLNPIAPTAITGDVEVFERDVETYSVTNMAGYTYDWTITNGTILSGDLTNSISVDWDEIGPDATSSVTGIVSVVAQSAGCTDADPFAINVNVRNTIIANQDGQWSQGSTWLGGVAPADPTDKVRIPGGINVHTIAGREVKDLTVESTGSLQIRNGNFTVHGNLVVDGTINDDMATVDLLMQGMDTSPVNSVSGTGNINLAQGGAIRISGANKQILAGSGLTVDAGNISIADGFTVTNLGSITVNEDIVGEGAGSGWTNGANANLTIGGNLLTTGSLSAAATDNTITLTNSGMFSIKLPTDSYHNLTLAGTGTATFGANFTIAGDLNLQDGTLDVPDANYRIILGGDWNHSGGTFDPQQGTIELNGANDQLIINTTGTQTETFHFLDIGKPSGVVTIQDGTTVRISGTNLGPGPGEVEFLEPGDPNVTGTTGIINTSATARLIFEAGSSTSGADADSYVDGPVTKIGNTNFEFPIGDGGFWAPIRISGISNGNVNDEITAEYFAQAFSDVTNFVGPDLKNVSTVEYWDVDVTAVNLGAGFSTNLTLFWKDIGRSNIDDGNDLRIVRYNGAAWEDLGKAAIPATGMEGSITTNNVENFSPFTFGSASDTSNPLPVDLLSFEARLIENQTELIWTTTSELNNDFFEVQRSEDGTEWEIVGEVDGNGTVNEIINYAFTDPRPLFGKSFYRLRQVDFDGQFEYSPVVSVNNPFTGESMEVLVFPNPTEAGNINLRVLTGNKENKISLQLIDALGHRFIDENMNPGVFSQDLIISPRESLAKGVYFLIVTQNNQAIRQRLIIN